jgi:hypothetical protein
MVFGHAHGRNPSSNIFRHWHRSIEYDGWHRKKAVFIYSRRLSIQSLNVRRRTLFGETDVRLLMKSTLTSPLISEILDLARILPFFWTIDGMRPSHAWFGFVGQNPVTEITGLSAHALSESSHKYSDSSQVEKFGLVYFANSLQNFSTRSNPFSIFAMLVA